MIHLNNRVRNRTGTPEHVPTGNRPGTEIGTVAPNPASFVATGRGVALTVRKRKGQAVTPQSKGALGYLRLVTQQPS